LNGWQYDICFVAFLRQYTCDFKEMDGQTLQPNITPGQPQATPPPAPNSANGGMKVIQPLSPDLRANADLPQAPTPEPPTYDARVRNPQNLASPGATPPLQPRPNPNSIYPNPTQDVSSSPNQPATYAADTATVAEQPVAPAGNKAKIIVAIVMAIGAFIVVTAALSLIAWIRVLMLPGTSSGSSILGPILTGGQVLLGLGILMRRELARQIYVVLAVISLVFSVFGHISITISAIRLVSSNKQ
jgi:hypothetical protein